jgi:hypothetical protein
VPIGQGAGLFGYDPFHGPRGFQALGPFALDVLVTALPLLALGWWIGERAVWIAGLAGAAAVLAMAFSYVLMASGLLPFAGLPLPVATYPGAHVALASLWLDCLGIGLGGALAFGRRR